MLTSTVLPSPMLSGPPPTAGRPLRILIVKDSPADAEAMLLALRRGGLEPTWERVETADGLQAALAAGRWDAVLSDYTLPGFGAPAALEVVRRADRDVPFIVVSGTVGEDAAVALMRATASDYVLKHNLIRLAPTVEREVREAVARRAKRAADRAAAHLAAVVESSDDAIISKTLEGVITSWNAAAERLYGWTAVEAIGRNVSFLVPPDKDDEFARNMERLRAGQRVGYFETVRMHRDGLRIDIALTISPVRGADGRLVGVSKTARDIRDRKRAEVALRTSEARYRGLIESIPALVWVSDAAGRSVLHNRHWYEYTGQTQEDAANDQWRKVIHPDDAAEAVAVWDRCKASGEPYIFEYRLRRADGAYRWFLSNKTATWGPDGIEQWVGTCTDIDDRKRAEKELRRTADLLTAVAKETTDAVFVKDRDGKYLLFNEAAARFVGRTIEEVLGNDDTALFGADDARRVMAQSRSIMESGRTETTEEELTAAGTTRTYLATHAPYRDDQGDVIGVIGIAHDITERRLLSAERDKLLARLQLNIERMPLAYILFDADLTITDWNPAAAQIFGYGKGEALGKGPFDLVPPSFRHEATELLARIRAGDMAAHSVNENLTKDGRTITCEWLNTPLTSDDGRFVGLLCLAQDVTGRKRTEQRLTTQHAVVSILAQSPDLREAAPRLLRAICETTGWDVGILWVVDRQANVLSCVDALHVEGVAGAEYLDVCRHSTFAPGAGLPGRVWAARQPAWIVDITTDANFPRAAEAARAGLRNGFGFPVQFGSEILGVAEFFSRQSRQPDEELLRMFDSLGSQIGQFIERKRAEEELRLFRALIDQTTDGIEVIDPESGRFLDVNEQSCVSHGYTRDEFLSMGVLDIDPVAAGKPWGEIVGQLRLTGHRTLESLHRRKDGSTFPVEINVNSIRLDRDYMVAVVRDITDRKRAEDSLRQSEVLKAAIVESSLDCIVTMDTDGRIVEFNPAAERTFGYARAAVLGKTVADVLMPPDFRECHTRGLMHYLATGEGPVLGRRIEVAGLRADGTNFPVELTVTRIPTDGPPLFTAYLRDITDWKLAEQVRTEQARLASLVADVGLALNRGGSLRDILGQCTEAVVRHLDAAFARIWTLNGDDGVLELQASAGMYTHIDGPHGRVPVGRLKIGLIAQERRPYLTNTVIGDPRVGDQDWARREGMVAFAGYPLLLEDRLVGVMAMFARKPLTNRILDGLGGVANQIALGIDRKLAEVSLHASEERIRLLLDSAVEAIYGIDLQGQCTFCNMACARFLGYADPSRLIGKGMHALIHHTRANGSPYPVEECRINLAFRQGQGTHVDDEVLWRADGTSFPAECWSNPIRRDGQIVGAAVSFLDITDRKRLENQFHQAQKMEAVGQLAGGVAHDFNNLLTVINGYSDLLLQSLPPSDPSREFITEIHKAGERSAGLTRQLLAFSRQQILAPRVLDLNEVVTDTEKMLRRMIGEDMRLATKLEHGLWAVRADPGQVEQVLMNLAVNARDAMPRGGRMTIETRNVELDESYVWTHPDARPGPHVLLSVTDTGSGMPPEVKARLFEPFFTTKGPGQGTGLGLSTVYGIVRQSGGHIGVHSEIGVGTTFKVFLPRAEASAQGLKVHAGIRVPPRGKETILIAEDEDAVRALTRRVLVGCGYTVLEATDGANAVQIAAGHAGPIHLLITDVVMPGAGGRAVAEQLTEEHPGIRVLFMSGYTDDAVLRHGVLSERVNFLQKPFSPAALAFKVRHVLDATAEPTIDPA
jgi:PAS domain S-box-containing protein